MSREPLLTTSVVGSHARPGWLVVGAAADRGELGPADIQGSRTTPWTPRCGTSRTPASTS